MSFSLAHPALLRALLARGYGDPTPVQSAVLAAGPRDLLVSAQTGSGKTVAYGLAMAPTLLGPADRFERPAAPRALVIAPTRELAIQVHGELAWLYLEAAGQVVSCVGGMDPRRERDLLRAGAHIVVGTPGRLRDHIERGQLDLSQLAAVVLDEADEMLDLGFREDLTFMLEAMPAARQTLLFSATIARDIAALASKYQRDALRIDTQGHRQAHADIEYRALRIAPNEAERATVNILRASDSRATLIFCATREAVRRWHGQLLERGFAAVALSGELSQNERTHALQSLRDGRARVCIATDVAARGLDLPALDLVIHADLPTNKESLLHRSGRTGRAGRKGVCILLVPHSRRRRTELLLASANIVAQWGSPPSAAEVRAADQQRFLADPILTEPANEDDLALGRQVLARLSAEQVAAALVRLARARLPAPEDLFDIPPEARRHPPTNAAEPNAEPNAEMVQFRLSIGRTQKADPKWLVPLICRAGGVTKREIGRIRIQERDTLFEIAAPAAADFASRLAAAPQDGVRIEPCEPLQPSPPIRRPPPKRPKYKPKRP